MAEAEVIPLRNAKLVSDLDAEQAVLSAIMNAPERYDEVVETCGPKLNSGAPYFAFSFAISCVSASCVGVVLG